LKGFSIFPQYFFTK